MNLLQCSFSSRRIFQTILRKQYKIRVLGFVGPVAQRLEQRTHNPLVVGSNPTGPTTNPSGNAQFCRWIASSVLQRGVNRARKFAQ
jgi:hypothetical protein